MLAPSAESEDRALPCASTEPEAASRAERWGFWLLMGLGAVLRLGLFPAVMSHDEGFFALVALRYVEGDLNPYWFGGPAGPLFYAFASVLFSTWAVTCPFTGLGRLEQVALWREHLDQVVLLGRVVPLLAGLGTLWALYRLVGRLQSRRAGLVAMAFLATSPLHVELSAYVHKEILATFFLVLVFWQSLRLLDSPGRAEWLRLGVLMGLLVGMKVTYVIAGFVPAGIYVLARRAEPAGTLSRRARHFGLAALALIGACLLVWSRELLPLPPRGSMQAISWMNLEHLHLGRDYAQGKLKLVAFGLLGAASLGWAVAPVGAALARTVLDPRVVRVLWSSLGTFFLFNPYVLITPVQALTTLLVEMAPKSGADSVPFSGRALAYVQSLGEAGTGGTAGLVGGIALLVFLWRGKTLERLLAAYGLLFLLLISNAPLVRTYWLVSLLPLVAAFASLGLAHGLRRFETGRLPIGLILAALLTLPGLSHDVARVRRAWLPDSRTLATAWMLQNVPRGSVVAWTWYTMLPPQGTYQVEDLVGDSVAPYRQKGCRYAIVSDLALAGLTEETLPGVFKELRQYPLVWSCAGDGRTLTGPSIKVYRLQEGR